MYIRTIVPAILGAVLIATPVLAATPVATPSSPVTADTPSHRSEKAEAMAVEKCTSLEQQFDAAIKTHGSVSKANAMMLVLMRRPIEFTRSRNVRNFS